MTVRSAPVTFDQVNRSAEDEAYVAKARLQNRFYEHLKADRRDLIEKDLKAGAQWHVPDLKYDRARLLKTVARHGLDFYGFLIGCGAPWGDINKKEWADVADAVLKAGNRAVLERLMSETSAEARTEWFNQISTYHAAVLSPNPEDLVWLCAQRGSPMGGDPYTALIASMQPDCENDLKKVKHWLDHDIPCVPGRDVYEAFPTGHPLAALIRSSHRYDPLEVGEVWDRLVNQLGLDTGLLYYNGTSGYQTLQAVAQSSDWWQAWLAKVRAEERAGVLEKMPTDPARGARRYRG